MSQSTTKKTPNLDKLLQTVFLGILVELVVLNSILKVYPILTSGKGSFPRWRPIWGSQSYNSHISIIIQSRKVMFWDFGTKKAMKSLKLWTANYYWLIQDGGIKDGCLELNIAIYQLLPNLGGWWFNVRPPQIQTNKLNYHRLIIIDKSKMAASKMAGWSLKRLSHLCYFFLVLPFL